MMLALLFTAQIITTPAGPLVETPIIQCAIDGTDDRWSEYNHTCHEDPAERGLAPFPPEKSCLAACTVIPKTRP